MSLKNADQQALVLTYLGALPFLLALLIGVSQYIQMPEFLGGEIADASHKSRAVAHSYAVVIVSFLAGTQWGITLQSAVKYRLYLISNVLALIAWFSLLLFATLPALTVLIVAFILALWIDHQANKRGMLPDWYWQLRKKITAIVVISLALIIGLA